MKDIVKEELGHSSLILPSNCRVFSSVGHFLKIMMIHQVKPLLYSKRKRILRVNQILPIGLRPHQQSIRLEKSEWLVYSPYCPLID